jgi:hypothetical protein
LTAFEDPPCRLDDDVAGHGLIDKRLRLHLEPVLPGGGCDRHSDVRIRRDLDITPESVHTLDEREAVIPDQSRYPDEDLSLRHDVVALRDGYHRGREEQEEDDQTSKAT